MTEHPSEPKPVGTANSDWPSRRAGLRDDIAAALEAADYSGSMRRGDLADSVMPVLYREWPWLRVEADEAGLTDPEVRAQLQAVIKALGASETENKTLRAKVAEFDHIINWHTTCASCARILDSAIRETERAEKAEGALREVLAAADAPTHCHEHPTTWDGGGPCAYCTALVSARAVLDRPRTESGVHVYLSTGCYHNDHAYCQAMTGLNGAKRPASCKFCHAACQCPCHQQTAPPVHIGGGANAEDCPACSGTNPPYPFICPGPDAEQPARTTAKNQPKGQQP